MTTVVVLKKMNLFLTMKRKKIVLIQFTISTRKAKLIKWSFRWCLVKPEKDREFQKVQ